MRKVIELDILKASKWFMRDGERRRGEKFQRRERQTGSCGSIQKKKQEKISTTVRDGRKNKM